MQRSSDGLEPLSTDVADIDIHAIGLHVDSGRFLYAWGLDGVGWAQNRRGRDAAQYGLRR